MKTAIVAGVILVLAGCQKPPMAKWPTIDSGGGGVEMRIDHDGKRMCGMNGVWWPARSDGVCYATDMPRGS